MSVPAQRPNVAPCRLAFLGEAPGDVEEQSGIPFTGPSGLVFNGGLRAAGIERADCWVGNVFEEKAPGNDVGPWMRDQGRVEAAKVRLRAELGAAQPTVIVPMGGTALELLTGYTEISRLRGNPRYASDVLPNTQLLPTYHPAHILRQWKLFPLFIGDLVKAAAAAERGPFIHYPRREFTVEPDVEEVRKWVGEGIPDIDFIRDGRGQAFPCLLNALTLSIDIETGWGQITCIAFAPDQEHAICIPFVDLRKPSRSYWGSAAEETEVWHLVKTVLESPIPKLGQNLVYDIYWLLTEMGIRPMNYRFDTRLAHHALYPELPKDLASLSAAYSDAGWKHWGQGKEDKRDA